MGEGVAARRGAGCSLQSAWYTCVHVDGGVRHSPMHVDKQMSTYTSVIIQPAYAARAAALLTW